VRRGKQALARLSGSRRLRLPRRACRPRARAYRHAAVAHAARSRCAARVRAHTHSVGARAHIRVCAHALPSLRAPRSASPPRENKLLAVPRGIGLHALRRRLADANANGASAAPSLRYRLPGEAAGSEGLMELSSEEDFALMLEEYDALQARAPHGGPASRLHVYVLAADAVEAPASPRSVLRRWRAAAATAKASRSRSPSSDDPCGEAAAAVAARVLRSESADAPGAPPAGAPPAGGTPGVQSIAAADMQLGPRLGDGTYAVVHAGWWRGASVAIKILRSSPSPSAASSRAAAAFARECSLLARLQHPNVLALYGVVAPGCGPPAAVLELMPHGSLRAALRQRGAPPCRRTAAALALGAARAMQHLHAQSPPVAHFDLKADNLLVDWRVAAAPVCKLADLGLACAVAPAPVAAGAAAAGTCVAGRGTLWWMAPELFPDAAPAPGHAVHRVVPPAREGLPAVDVRLDVFSFGLVIWEIASAGREPYGPGASPEQVMAAVRAGARPAPPPGCDAQWRGLMQACWAARPEARPHFGEIVPILARMAA
jgi:hypothetical protein